MTEKRLELVRGLGAWASAAIVVGTMIGTGIFLKPAEMAREGRSVSVVFAAWIVGAILSIFGALRLSAPRLRARMGISLRVDAFDRGAPEFAVVDFRRHDAISEFSASRHRGSALHHSHRDPGAYRMDQTV